MHKGLPSNTAYKVAMNIVTLGAKPGMDDVLPPGIVDATEKLLIAAGVANASQLQWSRSRTMVSMCEAFDWMLPGQFEAFGRRKAFCERQVRDAIGSGGATQVLVLGAGYDTLGWRLAPKFPVVNFFEIDHPAAARLKAKGIEAMGQHDNLWLIPADLGKPNSLDVLKSNASWDERARTVIIAEGLVMYLSHEAVRNLFCQCADIAGAGSRVVFSYFGTGQDGRPDAGLWSGMLLWTMQACGEPWVWSIRPEELGPFLKDTGWTNVSELAEASEKHGAEFYGVATK
jgi:methyltransferase (TIGR00027 family)